MRAPTLILMMLVNLHVILAGDDLDSIVPKFKSDVLSKAIAIFDNKIEFHARKIQRAKKRLRTDLATAVETAFAENDFAKARQIVSVLQSSRFENDLKSTSRPADDTEKHRADITELENILSDANARLSQLESVVGDWQGHWGTSVNRLALSIDGNGHGKHLKLHFIDGRILMLGEPVHENLELIPRGDRLIVLGWTGSYGRINRDPFKDQPNHVAILRRVK